MIPKVIHYCWFGGERLSDQALKCINTWKKYLPSYEIKEWNESNFDVTCCDYVKEAYQEKKWAFVSDYARFKILYEHGGLYFDTDVEIIKKLDDIINQGSFMGVELSTQANRNGKTVVAKVNPGLGLAAEPKMDLFGEVLNFYHNLHFLNAEGEMDITTVVEITTNLLKQYGYVDNNKFQTVAGINIFPGEYFCPLDYCTGIITVTENTKTIHWYSSTWFTRGQLIEKRIKQFSSKFGKKSYCVDKILSFPVRVWNKLQSKGLKGTLRFCIEKLKER